MNKPAPHPHRRSYWVWMNLPDGELTEAVQVTVTYADQLRAELEAPKSGLPSMAQAPMHYATCWVWAAMVREGLYDQKFGQFRTTDLGELEPIHTPEEVAEAAGEGATDPT